MEDPRPQSRRTRKQALLYERLRHVAELQGPTYVKLAQLISAAEGVFPEALVAECKKCRDQVSPEPWAEVSKVLNDELGTEDQISFQ